jgi:hypothetical protein
MLHKALDTARAQRDVEFEHSSSARQTFATALGEEMESEAAFIQANADIKGATNQVNMVEGLDAAYEDTERLRDLSVVHAAHDEEQDWMVKVKNAESIASQAKLEFQNAERKLQELEQQEVELKQALKELHVAKNALMMKKWKQQRGG